MSYGPVSVFTVSMASGSSFSSAADLSKAWNKISVVIPSMPSGSDIYFNGATELAGSYKRIFHAPTTVSATVGAQFLGSGVSNCIVPLHNAHVRYFKVELSSATVDNAYTYKIICSD